MLAGLGIFMVSLLTRSCSSVSGEQDEEGMLAARSGRAYRQPGRDAGTTGLNSLGCGKSFFILEVPVCYL